MLCCRVHPGETPSSHALWGFVSYLCGRSKSAEALRRRCAFAVVPMLNPDGCFRGNYRTDSRGRDLNRHWVAPSPDELPTLHAAKALASRLARDPRFRLDFFVDVHAHTSSKCSFFFVNLRLLLRISRSGAERVGARRGGGRGELGARGVSAETGGRARGA